MEQLFTEAFFRQNDYFKRALKWDDHRYQALLPLIKNWQLQCDTFDKKVDKETTDESEFVEVVFKRILGHTGKASNAELFHIYPKFPIPGAGSSGAAGEADLALGFFNKKKKVSAQVLVEFKDQGSDDLDKPSPRKDHLSPTNQCWNYLDSCPSAKWGLVTNYNEIRIYNKATGKQRRQVFYFVVPPNLAKTQKPLSDEIELLKFISILSPENLLASEGKSFAEDMLERQGREEVRIETAFYTKYKAIRVRAFGEILAVNPGYATQKSRLLQLVQKLLDRVIFCWFCEDSRESLLPHGVLSKMIEEFSKTQYYKTNSFDLWAKVQTLFQAINVGGNFNIGVGYNGGLFKEDEDLNNLKIPNGIFEEIGKIGAEYDFGNENELNVNILGHIFEKSISDLEEMRKSFLEHLEEEGEQGPQFELALEVEKKKKTDRAAKAVKGQAKRKKDGVFYTPEHITSYIVENAVGGWLAEQYRRIDNRVSKQKLDRERTVLVEYRDEVLKKIKILDPACGSGAFLIAAFNYLWQEHSRVAFELRAIDKDLLPISTDEVERSILEENLFGVDLNSESVEITKLSLWLKTASRNKKLNNLDNNIKVGNSLISTSAVGGSLAFSWEQEFSSLVRFDEKQELVDGYGFDCVIGNPPYDVLSEKETGRKVDHEIDYFKTHPVLKYAIRGKSNLYKLFICRGLSLTKNGGKFSYIVPLPLVGDDQAASVRKYLFEKSSFKQIDCFPQKDREKERVFEDAKYSTCIFLVNKSVDGGKFKVRTHPGKYFDTPWDDGLRIEEDEVKKFDTEGLSIPFCKGVDWEIIKKIAKRKDFVPLGKLVESFQGEVNETTAKKYLTKKGGFPEAIRGANVTSYCVREASQGENFFVDDVKFLRGKGTDSKAVDFRKHRIGFQRSAPQDNFRRLISAPIPKNVFCFDTVSYVTSDSSKIDLDVLIGLLNSKLFDWWFRAKSTNSKINEYQFNELPFLKILEGEKVSGKISKMIDEEKYPELIQQVFEASEKNRVPEWALNVVKDLSKKIQLLEKKRKMTSKRERAFLAEGSQPYQRYLDQTIFAMFSLADSDAAIIESSFRNAAQEDVD